MATIEQFPQRQAQDRPYRTPPNNLEAEQALLGAILINNDAFDRVSDFLRSEHFVEEIHRRIFEIAGSLIRAGKLATPVTLKTFLGEHDLGGVTVPQYLARLASEATTIINAYDYGRGVYDLGDAARGSSFRSARSKSSTSPMTRRSISSPREQIEEAEQAPSTRSPRPGATTAASSAFLKALKIAVDMAARAYEQRRLAQRNRHRADRSRPLHGRPAGIRPFVILAGRPGMGKTAFATNIAFNIAKAYQDERAPTAQSRRQTAALSASSRSKCRPNSWRPASSLNNRASHHKIRRGDITESEISTGSPTRLARCSRSPSTSTIPRRRFSAIAS